MNARKISDEFYQIRSIKNIPDQELEKMKQEAFKNNQNLVIKDLNDDIVFSDKWEGRNKLSDEDRNKLDNEVKKYDRDKKLKKLLK